MHVSICGCLKSLMHAIREHYYCNELVWYFMGIVMSKLLALQEYASGTGDHNIK